MRGCRRLMMSSIFGFLLLIPLAWLFDRMDWPFFNPWSMIHGSVLLAWPLLTILVFVIGIKTDAFKHMRR